jgi:cupin fold WbuC family metalloprotein
VKLDFPSGALRPIGRVQMDEARALAAKSPRRRAIVRYHEHAEAVQRMMNALEPESYVRPHRHMDPDKLEVFVVLAGRALVLQFDDAARVTDFVLIAAEGPQRGVEIPPRTWHSVIALAPGTVLYEIIEGAFSPSTHKSFASWAPLEGTPEGAAFHEALLKRILPFFSA